MPKARLSATTFEARAVHGLHVEEQILRRLEHHPRIIRLRQKHEAGLLLEYMPNGTVGLYLRDVAPTCSLQQRLMWAHQAAEAVAYIHSRSVLHCDISIGNLLLDANLDIKLSDFQGRLLKPDGTILLNGGAVESPMSSMPRADQDYCDFKTDMFALGTTIFFIITGSQPFTDIDPVEEEEEVQRRFRDKEFPSLEIDCGGDIVRRCWMGLYQSAQEIVHDIERLEAALK